MREADREDEVLLQLEDVHVRYEASRRPPRWGASRRGVLGRPAGDGGVAALDGVSFAVRRGEVFGLVGESGSGKTTVARAITGIVPPRSGRIRWKGRDLARLPERRLRPVRRELGVIYQDPNAALSPAMTVEQAVGHPLRIHRLSADRTETRGRVLEMLERCGLAPGERFLNRYPDELSGGQRQRVVIARALVTRPEMVIADEPAAALDMSARARLLELLLELKLQLRLTLVYITHDLASARLLCDRIGVLYLGRLAEWGPTRLVYEDPQHPYTRALLSALPRLHPDGSAREATPPRGEVPDAEAPPAGCRFHPRCPEAFSACGWEGRDLVDALEQRWTQVGRSTFERELRLVGSLADAEVERDHVRFPCDDPGGLAGWLREVGPRLPLDVFSAVTEVAVEPSAVVIRFGPGPAPAHQAVRGRQVACHLHGITARSGLW